MLDVIVSFVRLDAAYRATASRARLLAHSSSAPPATREHSIDLTGGTTLAAAIDLQA